jgi:hypothetical protein
MSSEEINEKIKRWGQHLKTTIAGIEIRDVHAERLTPLQLDMRQLHEAYVESEKKKRRTNNEQG